MRKHTDTTVRNDWMSNSQYDNVKDAAHAAAKDVLAEKPMMVEIVDTKLQSYAPEMLMIAHAVIDRAIGDVARAPNASVAAAKLEGLVKNAKNTTGAETEYSKFMHGGFDDNEKKLFDRAVTAGLTKAEAELRAQVKQAAARAMAVG